MRSIPARARPLGGLLAISVCLHVPALGGPLRAGAPGEASRTLAAALERAAAGEWERLHVEVECRREGRMMAVELFESGVGIWEGARQFRLERRDLAALMDRIRAAGFAEMPASFGEVPGELERLPPRISCRVSVAIGGVARQVVQLVEGGQSAALRRLASDLLDACHEPAMHGVTAADLEDGLDRIARGELAAEAFRLVLNLRPESPTGALGAGWLLRVRGRRVELDRGGPGPETAADLSESELGTLARALSDARLSALPPNLWADQYTDLTVKVLDHEKQVLARRFAGWTPSGRAEEQLRFERALDAIRALFAGSIGEDAGRPRSSAEPQGSTSFR